MDNAKKTKTQLVEELDKAEASLEKAKKSQKSLRAKNRKLLSLVKDMTESQKATIQKERLHALGQMASGIVHDFNNALTPILGASDFLISNPDMLQRHSETLTLLESMRTAARDGRDMVKRLRSFYHPEENLEVAAVDMNQVVEQVILLTQSKWGQAQAHGQSITMKTDLQPVSSVVMNETHLREVLTNLVFNALDAMPEKGGDITLRTRSDDSYVTVEVQDTGKGMPEDIRRRCLEPFYSTKGRAGTGMGLAMVYGIVQKYDGGIDVESEEGKGTTIRIQLHASGDQVTGKVEVVVGPHPVHLLNVLVVDDNSPSRDVMEACLSADGHSVEAAADADEALSLCEENRFDVILLDVVMPGMSGLDMVSTLREKCPKMSIVLVTGSVDCVADGKTPDGVDIVLGKPVTQADLRRAIARVMTRKV